MEELGRRVEERLRQAGVRFGGEVYKLDPVPRILTPDEWELIERGVAQRVRALERFAADVYSAREAVAAGVVPERVLDQATHHEPAMRGARVKRWIAVAGLDLVRSPDGRFQVLEDQVRMPSGLGYAVAGRAALEGLLPGSPAGLDGAFGVLAQALRDAGASEDPRVEVISEGPEAAAWWEHERIAGELGVPLLTELDHADVVYQRTGDTPVSQAVLEACREGRLACVNAPGTGVCDDKVVHAYVPELIRFYLDEDPVLDSVRSYDLAEEAALEEALDRRDELVFKPRGEMGGEGVVVWSHATEEERERALAAVRSAPQDHVAQERVILSTHPTLCDGGLEPRHVDFRPYVLVSDEGPWVLPGGLTRVALERGSLIVNSGQGGGVKDTWVFPASDRA